MEVLIRVLELVLDFWIELVPSLGRELVLCCLTERDDDVVTGAGTGLGDGD